MSDISSVISFSCRCKDSQVRLPVHFHYSLVESRILNTTHIRPLLKALSHSIYRQENRSTSVARLFSHGSPSTIISAIMTIIIDTINRCVSFSKSADVTRISIVHITSKILESLPQTLYSASTIILVSWVFRICASLNNTLVGSVKSLLRHAMGRIFRLIFEATARFCPTATQFSSINQAPFTTITNAFIREASPLIFIPFFSYQFTKTLTSEILSILSFPAIDELSFNVSHTIQYNQHYSFVN